jgi:hypothetical protein
VKWIRTPDGDRDHAVPTGAIKTFCHIPLTRGCRIIPRPTNPCGTCDYNWREKGLQNKPKAVPSHAEYRPRFSFDDWESQP